MKIKSITYTMFYPKLNDIRRKIFGLEEQLSDFYVTPFNLLPIPDDAPVEIPRITAKSKHGHSEISISLVNTQVSVNFDSDYDKDFDKCFTYLHERINKIYDIFLKYSNNHIIYSGITTKLIFDELNEDPIEVMGNKFSKLDSNVRPMTLASKYAYVIDNTYYVNLDISNIR